jgi:hypothetical protein
MPANQATAFLRKLSEVVWARGSFIGRRTRHLYAAILAAAFALAAGTASAAQLTLNWQDNSDGTAGFQIERKTWTTDAFAQIATTGAGVTTYVDATVPAGTTFCYRVRAINSGGTSGYSNEACGVVMFSDDPTATARGTSLRLGFGGGGRDRVGKGPTGLDPDGALDAAFTLTLAPGAGPRTVTQLDLRRTDGSGIWDTVPGNIFWALGVALVPDGPLLNAGNSAVNFDLADGASVTLFAADTGGLFAPGSAFTLTATFSDGSTATASASVPQGTPSLDLAFDGFSSDRVARAPGAAGSDGSADGTFTLTLAPGSGARTVTHLDLRRTDNSGIWDTLAGDIYWTLGVASSFGGSLLNAGDGTVNFEFRDGSSVTLFAADKGGSFTAGSSFTLTATFSDGSTATATATAR